MANSNHQQTVSPFSRLVRLLQPEAADISVVAVFSLVVGLLSLATPITVEALVNTVAFGRYLQPLMVLALLLFTFLAFASLLRGLQTYIAEVIQRRIFVRVVAILAERLPRIRRDVLTEHNGPELLNRFFEVITVQKSAALLVLDGISVVIITFVGMIVLAFYHPYLLGFDLALMAALLFAVFTLGRGAVDTAIDESYKKYAVAAWLEQLATYPTTFKLAGGWRQAVEKADDLTVAYLQARRAHFRILLRQIAFALALQAVAGACLLGIGGFLVINGQLTLGQLVASELIVAVVVGSFTKLGKHMESYYDLLAACDKLGHLFDLPTERDQGVVPPRTNQGMRIYIHQVGLSRGSDSAPLVQATIEPGEKVVLTGPAGSGKSSLLEMLYATREPSAGHIELDAMDLRSIAPSKLREQVALLQGVEIPGGTIAENVHLKRPEIGYFEVRSALEAVGLWDEIMQLPAGLETELPLGGATLSGSQRIRLTLARAIAGRPRLILIDSQLDQLSEAHLQAAFDAIQTACPTATLIVVTNRETFIDRCDRVLRLPPAPGEGPASEPTSPSPDLAPRLAIVQAQ